jgi:CheY-like chemotaxis protein
MNRKNLEITKNILVLEDNPNDVDLIRRALAQAGIFFSLTVIDDGAQAIDFVANIGPANEPDLVIVDLNMPGHDGFEILAALKKNSACARIPVAVLSSSSLTSDSEKAKSFGAHFITKPSKIDEFLATGHIFRSLIEQAS